ncbi:hypothetical protein CMI37_29620 [Candidatus Pacearchaeota archaeon]|jgi:hypothetical protein|nr:hypothetical protein [Candidatus Pacearchaeota archaeon]
MYKMATKDWKKKSFHEYYSKKHNAILQTGEPHSIKKGKKIYSTELVKPGKGTKVLFKSPSIMKTHAFGRKYRKSHSK